MPYCTIEDLRVFGYDIQDSDMEYLSSVCDLASARVDSYCHQSFVYTEGAIEKHTVRVRNGELKIFPINMTQVDVLDVAYTWYGAKAFLPYTVLSAEYFPSIGAIIATTDAPDGDYAVLLTYSYGFKEYPADLVQATAFMAVPLLDDYYSAKMSNISGVKMIQQGKLKIDRAKVSATSEYSNYPANATTLLNSGNGGYGYVRVRAAI